MIQRLLSRLFRRPWVYHYHVMRQIPGGTQHIDGTVTVTLPITNTDLYHELKEWVAKTQAGDVDPKTITICSLSRLGRV